MDTNYIISSSVVKIWTNKSEHVQEFAILRTLKWHGYYSKYIVVGRQKDCPNNWKIWTVIKYLFGYSISIRCSLLLVSIAIRPCHSSLFLLLRTLLSSRMPKTKMWKAVLTIYEYFIYGHFFNSIHGADTYKKHQWFPKLINQNGRPIKKRKACPILPNNVHQFNYKLIVSSVCLNVNGIIKTFH